MVQLYDTSVIDTRLTITDTITDTINIEYKHHKQMRLNQLLGQSSELFHIYPQLDFIQFAECYNLTNIAS